MKKTIFTTCMILLMSIILFSCSNSVATTPYTQQQNTTKPLPYHTMIATHKTPSYDDTIHSSEEFILLVPNDTNAEQFTSEIGAELLRTLTIRKKLYILVKGLTQHKKTLHKNPKILSLEPNVTRTLHVNDTLYDSQYAPQITNLEEVWKTYTGKGVKIAVIDTGVNTLHKDFVDADGTNTAFLTGHDINTGQDHGTTENLDVHGHGTGVAGVIAARKDNNTGIVGVAPQSTIIPIKGSNDQGQFGAFAIAHAITKATELGADIINISAGGTNQSTIELDATYNAISKGIILVATSGNEYVTTKQYPASLAGFISVGSSNGRDEISSFSTRSPLLSVVAPGEDILTLSINNYTSVSGTSFAAPFVSGVAALLKEKFPTATPAQIKKILESTAKDIGTPGHDMSSGWGRVQPDKALETTTLPDATWTAVEFTVTLEQDTDKDSDPTTTLPDETRTAAEITGTLEQDTDKDSDPIGDYSITISSASNTPRTLHSIVTNKAGKASVFLATGTYTFFSNRFGVPFDGTIEVTSSDKITKTKNFTKDEYTNYFKFLIYHEDTQSTLDTVVDVQVVRIDNLCKPSCYYPIGSNDDISKNNLFSRLYFGTDHVAKNNFLIFTIFPHSYQERFAGPYRVILERGASTDAPEVKDSATTKDVTNRFNDLEVNGNTVATIKEFPALKEGVSMYGVLDNNANNRDVDYFVFDPHDVLSTLD